MARWSPSRLYLAAMLSTARATWRRDRPGWRVVKSCAIFMMPSAPARDTHSASSGIIASGTYSFGTRPMVSSVCWALACGDACTRCWNSSRTYHLVLRSMPRLERKATSAIMVSTTFAAGASGWAARNSLATTLRGFSPATATAATSGFTSASGNGMACVVFVGSGISNDAGSSFSKSRLRYHRGRASPARRSLTAMWETLAAIWRFGTPGWRSWNCCTSWSLAMQPLAVAMISASSGSDSSLRMGGGARGGGLAVRRMLASVSKPSRKCAYLGSHRRAGCHTLAPARAPHAHVHTRATSRTRVSSATRRCASRRCCSRWCEWPSWCSWGGASGSPRTRR